MDMSFPILPPVQICCSKTEHFTELELAVLQ